MGRILCLDALNGHVIWEAHVPYGVVSLPTIAPNGTILVTSNNEFSAPPNGEGCLSALSADGAVLWSTIFNGSLTAPTLAPNGVIYVCEKGLWNPQDSALYAVAPNGSVLWRSKPNVTFCPSPALGLDGTIYVSFQNNPVIAFYANGTVKWSALPISDPGEVTVLMNCGAISVGLDGTVYAGSYDFTFSGYYPNGTVKWTAACQDRMVGGIALAPDGTILASGRGPGSDWSCALYAFDPIGNLKWRYEAPSAFFGAPCISDDDLIFIPAQTQQSSIADYVIVLTLDGKESWRMGGFGMLNTFDYYSPITLGPNQTIFMPAIGQYSSILYAINVGRPTVPLEASAWTDGGHVRVSWNPPSRDGGSKISSYQVYRATLLPNSNIPDGGYVLIASVDGNSRSFYDQDARPNENGVYGYVYRVQASNSYGAGLVVEINQIDYDHPPEFDWIFFWTAMVIIVVMALVLVMIIFPRKGSKR